MKGFSVLDLALLLMVAGLVAAVVILAVKI